MCQKLKLSHTLCAVIQYFRTTHLCSVSSFFALFTCNLNGRAFLSIIKLGATPTTVPDIFGDTCCFSCCVSVLVLLPLPSLSMKKMSQQTWISLSWLVSSVVSLKFKKLPLWPFYQASKLKLLQRIKLRHVENKNPIKFFLYFDNNISYAEDMLMHLQYHYSQKYHSSQISNYA